MASLTSSPQARPRRSVSSGSAMRLRAFGGSTQLTSAAARRSRWCSCCQRASSPSTLRASPPLGRPPKGSCAAAAKPNCHRDLKRTLRAGRRGLPRETRRSAATGWNFGRCFLLPSGRTTRWAMRWWCSMSQASCGRPPMRSRVRPKSAPMCCARRAYCQPGGHRRSQRAAHLLRHSP